MDLFVNRQKYRHVIDCLDKFWSEDKFGRVAQKKVKDIRLITVTFIQIYICLLVFATVWCYFKIVLLQGTILPWTWISFCEVENNYCYVYTYTAQSLCITWVMMGILYYDTMSLLLLASAYQEFEQIKYAFCILPIDETVDGDDGDVLEFIGIIVKQHNLVLE